jgi:HK97 family phage portal protein
LEHNNMVENMTYDIKSQGAVKAIVNVPGWVEGMLSDNDKVTGAQAAYAYVPMIYRAVNILADSVASVPIGIKGRNGAEIDWPFITTPIDELMWNAEASLNLAGAAYWLKLSNTRKVKQLQPLNPFTMQVELKTIVIGKDKDGNPVTEDKLEFVQTVGSRSNRWTQDEVVYIREYSPSDDIGPGVCATDVALSDAQVIRYMTRFMARFFESGAMPITLLSVEGALSESERSRMEGWFARQATGIRNAWRVLAMRGAVNTQILTPPLKDMVVDAIEAQARTNIANAYGIPETMLADAANYATAKEHRISFWSDTVRPDGDKIASAVNRQLLNPMGMNMVPKWEQMDIFQEDEAERAESLNRLTAAGVPLITAMEILGYDLTDEQIAIIMVQDEPETQDFQENNDPLNQALVRWARVARRRQKDGKPHKSYTDEVIEPTLAAGIQAQLETCESVDDVNAIFDGAIEWRNYP